MSLKEWSDLHGEDYPSRFRRETSTKPPTIKDLQFCFDELLGELGWDDEIAETGVDPLSWARNEIKDLHKQIKRLRGSLELRNAAEQSVYADLKPVCPTCKGTGSVEYPCPNCRVPKTASSR